LTTPTPTPKCPNAIPDATGDFFFFGASLPKNKGGGVGWGRVQQQQQKSAATAAAAAARQGLNEIDTAMKLNRFLTCGIVVF
jgi:hypothetical protein